MAEIALGALETCRHETAVSLAPLVVPGISPYLSPVTLQYLEQPAVPGNLSQPGICLLSKDMQGTNACSLGWLQGFEASALFWTAEAVSHACYPL